MYTGDARFDGLLNEESKSLLLRVAPILRGAVAEASGNEDDPYMLPVLNIHCGRNVMDYLDSPQKNRIDHAPAWLASLRMPPLELDPFQAADPTDRIRESIAAAVARYRKLNRASPEIVFCHGLGIITVQGVRAGEIASLQNKTALVTGAAGAIGSAICEALADRGCLVAAGDLPGERLDQLACELNKRVPGRTIPLPLDVTDPQSLAGAFDSIVMKWGGIDIVVINAGVAMVAGLVEMELDDFRRLASVNMEGTLLTLAEAGRRLSLQGTGGDIVLISSKNVTSPGAQFGAYSATKAAAHQLCRIASLEFAADKIRVNMVSPDAVFAHGERKSGLWEEVGPDRMRRRGLDEKGLEEYYRERNLLKARVTAWHVANAVLFFVTRQTPTTGATIPVDGGLPDAAPR